MADFVEVTVREIDRRLGELGDERGELMAARAALVGALAPAPAATRAMTRSSGKPGTRSGRQRGGKDSRADQTLALIRENPRDYNFGTVGGVEDSAEPPLPRYGATRDGWQRQQARSRDQPNKQRASRLS